MSNLFYKSVFLNVFLVCTGIMVALTIYSVIIMPYVLKVTEEIETYNPKMIKLGALAGFIGFASLIITIFPAFGWMSPFMVFIMFLGFINIGHFVPGNALGSFIVAIIFVGAFFSFHLIEHEGHLHY